jgi:hypothetical protein
MKLGKLLLGAGIAAVGGYGVKKAVDYFKNRGQEEAPSQSEEEIEVAAPDEELAYAVVEESSVQDFLDRSFGNPGRYVPTRPPKIFDYQDQQYMVIWARDNEKDKNQLLAFEYTDAGRSMRASVGYTADATDYNINLDGTSFAIEVNGEQITSGQGETGGTDEVDFVLAN